MNNKILIAEDNPVSLRLLVYTLQHEGYQVLTTANGLEGLRKTLKEKLNLVILDVTLSGIDSLEVCHRMRTEPQTSQLPILMLSANGEEIDSSTWLNAGTDDYISIPWNPQELVTKIATLLERKRAILSSNLERRFGFEALRYEKEYAYHE